MRKQLDGFFSILSRIIPIDLMPGENDLSSCLPQEPFPKFLFPQTFFNSSSIDKLTSKMVMASNPHRFIIDNVDILGTSGKLFKNL